MDCMPEATFWKPKQVGLVEVEVLPLGPASQVASKILDIPRMHVFLSYLTFHGYLSFLWDVGQGITVAFRDEPEFGRGGVFSIMVMDRHRVLPKDFFRLYVQVSEQFGVVLLEDDGFVGVQQFKTRLA